MILFRVNKFWLRLQQFFADHIDPDGIQPLQAVRTAIAGIIAIGVYHALPWPQAYWVLLATILLLQTYVGNTPTQKIVTLFIITLSATLFTLIASQLGGQPFILAIFLSLTTFAALYCVTFSQIMGSLATYVNLFCISAGALPVDAINSHQRALSVLLGGGIALMVCLGLWPERLSQQVRQILQQLLYRLADYNNSVLLRSEDTTAITIRRNRFIRGMTLARQKIPEEEIQAKEIVKQIEYFYETLLRLYQLKDYLAQKNMLRFLSQSIFHCLQHSSEIIFYMQRQLACGNIEVDLEKFFARVYRVQNFYARRRLQLNEAQLLALTVYLEGMHKLKSTLIELIHLLNQKYFT